MWPDLPKGSYTCTVSRPTFNQHLIATSIDQWYMCVIQQNVKQSAFTQASFPSLLTSISAQVLFKRLRLSLRSSQLAVIYDTAGWWIWPWIWLLYAICGSTNSTNGCHLAVLKVDIALACHFVALHPSPPSHPIEVLSGIGYASKNYL